MRRFSGIWPILLLGALAPACDDADSGGTPPLTDTDARVRTGDAEAPDRGVSPIVDMAPEVDAEPMIDAEPDAGLIRNLEDCADVCRVYANCDRLDVWPDGGEDACLAACEDAQRSPAFTGYLSCMQITSCANIDDCVMPARPRPDCAEVCAAADACGATERVPGGLPTVRNCVAACGDRALGQTVVDCGEALVYDEDACDEAAFAACFLEVRAADCYALCERRAECEAGIDVIDCTLECAQPPAVEDPVVERRQRIARTCAREAATCDELAQCGRQATRPIVGDATVEEMCAANADCGFLAVETCEDDAPPLLRSLADGAVDCFAEHFTERCEEPPFSCFAPAPLDPLDCDEYCAVAALCGTLPDGQLEFECAQQCRAAVGSGDPALIAPYRPLLNCAFESTCAAIATCNEAAGAGADCVAYCARRSECGRPAGDNCEADCVARALTVRGAGERACTLAAATCDGVANCEAPPPPDCAALCAPLAECNLGGPRCEATCDDAHFVNPDGYLPLLACVASTQRCDERAACLAGQLGAGAACLAWCHHEACGGEVDLTECVQRCGAGLPGADGLLFDGARECLANAGADAECAALDACLAAVQPGQYCIGFCNEQARCRLVPDANVCAGACVAAADEPETIDQAACVLAAARSSAGCATVAECVGAEVEPATPACAALCDARHVCDEDIDAFLCERDCMPEPEGTPLRAACAGRASCEQLPMCLDAPADVPADCAGVCAALGACPGTIGAGADARFADRDACEADCGGAAVLQDPQYPAALQGCINNAMCDADAITACYERGPGGTCEDAWDALVACNNQDFLGLGDRGGFLDICEMSVMSDPATTRAQIACYQQVANDAMGDPFACLGQIACLLPMGP